jgi:maltose O-acetyltransferase
MDVPLHDGGQAVRPSQRRSTPDPETLRAQAADLLAAINDPATSDTARARAIEALLGAANGAAIRTPFTITLGKRTYFDEACFIDRDCVIDDLADVRVGAFTQIAAGVRILTADPATGTARPVRIGRNVWIGAGAVICPGVRIGDDAIVGAGTTVDQDVPEGATIAGTPPRIMV